MGTLYRNHNKYGGGGSGGSIFHNYSTDEQIVGKWIDGSDVYEKTIIYTGGHFGDSPQNLVLLTGVKNIIEKNVIYSDSNLVNGTSFCIDGFTGQANGVHYATRLSVDNEGNVIVYIGGAQGTVNINAVLRYTKL